MPNSPGDRFNRKGCVIIFAVLALFIILYLVAGLSAQRGKTIMPRAQTSGASTR